jgi:transketolase
MTKTPKNKEQNTISDKIDFVNLELIAKQVKLNALETIKTAGTGHLGACCSSAELMTTLYFSDILRIDKSNPHNPHRDYVLNRGHLGPLRYNIFTLLGWMEKEEMKHYRELGSRLCGHEDMNITPGVDLSPSGSLGMLLSYSVGATYSFNLNNKSNRVFCFLGDGEEQEGNVSEAARHATNLNLKNLIVIIDKNKKQLSTSTKTTDGAIDLQKIWKGYGWNVLSIENGHNVNEIYDTYKKALTLSSQKPTCIIADTIKGNGVPFAEQNYNGYHVVHITAEDEIKSRIPIDEAILNLTEELKGKSITIPDKKIPDEKDRIPEKKANALNINLLPEYSDAKGTSYEFLHEFMNKLSEFGADRNIYVLTADYPPRGLVYDGGGFAIPNFKYCNVGVREQHVLAMAHGIKTVEKDAEIIVLCGDPFVYRFADQMNVLAQSKDKITIYAVQAGISGAQNGATHQSMGQPGAVLTMPGIDFFEPASKKDLFYVMNKALNESGLKYIRTHKNESPFAFDETRLGPFYSANPNDRKADCTIISSGMLVPEAVEASKTILKSDDIVAKVINVLELKNVDNISEMIEENKPLFIFYNGPAQILGYNVLRDMAKSQKNVSKIIEKGFTEGRTGSTKDLLRYSGLDAQSLYTLLKANL